MAQIIIGKVAITPAGTWDRNKSYPRLSEVVYDKDGCGYVSLKTNIGIEPGTDESVWIKVVNAGRSIYELSVKYGLFDGSEEEFTRHYNQAVESAQNAAKSANDAASACDEVRVSVTTLANGVSAAEAQRQQDEEQRKNAESGRASAEQARVNNELARQSASATAVQNCEASKQAADTAAANANTKAQLAQEKAEYAETTANAAATTANAAAQAANKAAATASSAAEDVVTPAEVLVEHVAKLENDVAALMERIDKLGDARAKSLTMDVLFKICGRDFYTEGEGAPTTAGVCQFAEYYDKTSGVFYKYTGSSWKALN